MTWLPFSQVVLPGGQAEVKRKGRGDGSEYRTSADGASSRMCNKQNCTDSNLEQKKWRAGGCYLKAWWDCRETLRRYKLAFIFFLLCIFVKKLVFHFESRTQISTANQLHAGLVVSTIIFFSSLFLSIQASASFRSYCITNYPRDRK